MKKLKLKVIKARALFFVMMLLSICPLRSFAFNNGDFQYWSTVSATWKASEKLTAHVVEEFRFGDNAGDFYYKHTVIGFTYSGLAKWIDTGLAYRHVYLEKNSVWKMESRPYINTVLKWKKFGAKFSHRLRFSYRDKEDAVAFWMFRNKLTVKPNWKFTKWKIKPYLADEIFYDFKLETLNKNRIYAGFNMAPLDFLKIDIFYLLESNKVNNKWPSLHVLGSAIKLYF